QVNVLLNGHDRMYEHSLKSNVHYVTVTSYKEDTKNGGLNPYSISNNYNCTAAAILAITNGVCTVTIKDSSLASIDSFVISNTSYFTASGVPNPSNQSAVTNSANPFNEIALAWSANAQGQPVMIVRKKSSEPWTEPAPGTSYAVGATLGSGVVVCNGNGGACTNTGLNSSTTYDYKFYSVSNSYYSLGVTAQATTAVLIIADPSNQSAVTSSANPFSQIDVAWSRNAQNHNVMVVRKKSTEAWTEPAPGTPYTAGATIGSGVVVYNGNGVAYTDSGLSPTTTYDYKFYSETNSYYSAGVTAQASTTPVYDPSSQTAAPNSANPSNQIDVAWSKNAQNHNVMIVRRKSTEIWTEPTQGTPYTAGATIGSGLVVYNGSGTAYANTSLSPGTTYAYKFYSTTYDYYSAGVTAQATTAPDDPSSQSRLSFWRTPYLQNMTTAAVTIMWWNNTNTAGGVGYAAGRVEYGKTGYELSSAADHVTTNTFSGQTGIVHCITLENLDANCDYLYRVICGGATNGSSFRTFPAATDYNAQVTFAVQGDASLGNYGWKIYPRYRKFCDWQASNRPSAFLLLGDIVTDGEPLLGDAWQVFFTNGAPLLAKSPSYITLGNHEYNKTTGLLSPGYDEAFSFPTNGPVAGHIYSFDCGIAHITVCEINNAFPYAYLPGSPQFTWVTNDLARTSKPWKIVILHNTIYTSGNNQSMSVNLANYYVPEFEKYKVNLCFNGHDHMYEHSLKSNVHYLTLSTLDQTPTNFVNPYSVMYIAEYGAAALLTITGEVCTATVMGSAIHDSENPIELTNSFVITNTAFYYFTVKDLNPTNQVADPISSSEIDLFWSKDAYNHRVLVIRKKRDETWTEPTQGTPYAVGTNIGNSVVVYSSDGTAYENSSLNPNTTYDYKLYSENNAYYSSGVTAAATTTPEPCMVMAVGVAMLAARRQFLHASFHKISPSPRRARFCP
ncbi:MAG: metallophosphoesterase, partial [bacterium]|nr:metallophosphoesterase [bacterium]